jgi:flagellar biosynthesis/type III secretory pathway chaperone
VSVQREQVRSHLERILSEEAELLEELERVLTQETEVLSGDDTVAIQGIGGARQRCIDALTRLDAERADACRMLSFGHGAAALDKLFAWSDPSQALRQQWLRNLELGRRCKDINERNGAIVSVKLGRVRQALGKLRGAQPPAVYGRRGTRYGSLAARELGRA